MKTLDVQARIRLKNILFCTDLSDAATAAFPYAAGLARHFGSKLYALHVKPWDQLEEFANQWRQLSEADTRQEINELFEGSPGIDSEVLVEKNELWHSVESVIQQKQIDLVVLGTRGRSGLAKVLLGSAAEEIIRRAPCPVLSVGPHASTLLLGGGGIAQILYATDFSPESIAAAPYAISLAQEYQAHLTLLHVLADSQTGDLPTSQQFAASSERRLRELVPQEVELWCEPRFVIGHGSAGETILQVAEHRKADLIVLGVRRAAGVPGAATHLPIATAHKVVSHARCPVLTVRG